MDWNSLILRFFASVILLTAVLVLLPGAAQAHPGHAHEASPASSRARAPVQEAQTLDRAAPGQIETAASDLGHPTGKSSICLGGCCSSSMGCCAVWLAPPSALFAPPANRLQPDLRLTRGAGITPGALPEPPRFLA